MTLESRAATGGSEETRFGANGRRTWACGSELAMTIQGSIQHATRTVLNTHMHNALHFYRTF
jgi:hypothetical protein